jgi:hypothetical protein
MESRGRIILSDVLRYRVLLKLTSAFCGDSAQRYLEMNLPTTNTIAKKAVTVTDTAFCRASRVAVKSARITFRLPLSDRQALENLVAGSDKTISDWIRDVTLNSIQKQKTSLSA